MGIFRFESDALPRCARAFVMINRKRSFRLPFRRRTLMAAYFFYIKNRTARSHDPAARNIIFIITS